MLSAMSHDQRFDLLRSLIRDVPDFPKKGILFKDITPLLGHALGFTSTIDLLAEKVAHLRPNIIAAPESRGFIFGAPLARALGAGFVPIRKPGKLPWKTIEESYALEYGTDRVQMHEDAVGPSSKVVVVDDLLATGGTMGACCRLLEKAGAKVLGCAFVIELGFLDGRKNLLNRDLYSLLSF